MYVGPGSKIRRVTSIIMPLLGIIIFAAFLVLVWFWESKGREMFVYTETYVASQDIKVGTVITENMISIEKIEKTKVINNPVLTVSEIINKVAKTYIPRNAQIHASYLMNADMVLAENEYITKIPNEWIKSVPSTLRRNDTVYIYKVSNSLFHGVRQRDASDSGQIIPTYSTTDDIYQNGVDPILKAKVAYVKDSTNREVVTVSEQDRYDGSATLTEVDLILTQEQFKMLETTVSKGYMLILMYREGT